MVYINTTGKHNEVWLDKPYATITVECPDCPSTEDAYNSGWTDGSEDGYHKGYQSGYTDGLEACSGGSCEGIWEDGYDSGYTDAWQPAYDSGYTDGLEACSGETIHNQYKYCNIGTGRTDDLKLIFTGNCYTFEDSPQVNITYDSGYTGLERVGVFMYFYPTEALQEGFNSGYTSGYTDGLNACSGGSCEGVWEDGYLSGVTDQKNKLTSTAITQNGTYTRADGWSSVTINVSGYSQADLDAAFASGYSAGLRDCSGYTPETEYLTIEAHSAGTLFWYANNSSFTRTIECSKDKESWSSVTSTNENSGTVITTVQVGDKVYLRGENDTYCDTEHQNYFITDFKFDVYGNVMSLIDKEDFVDVFDFTQPHALCSLFYSCTNLVSAADLILPATGLTRNCYEAMFYICTSLTGTPVLPATVLADRCYMGMFANCNNLASAPELPATVLVNGCYKSMFRNCRSLEIAPELPAAVLTEDCYSGMFENTSLNYLKCLATDISANNSTYRWVSNTSNTGTFVKNTSMSSWTTGINGIPENWTVQDAN